MKPGAKPCPGRMHQWGTHPPTFGAICLRCGHHYGVKRRDEAALPATPPTPLALPPETAPQAPTPPAPLPDELAQHPERNAALAARWATTPEGSATPNAPGVSSTPATTTKGEISTAEAIKLARYLRSYVADGLIAAERWIIDWRGYVPKDPDQELREELHECVEIILTRLLPSVSVGPWGKLAVTSTMLYATMRIGAVRKRPELALVPSPDGAGGSGASRTKDAQTATLSPPVTSSPACDAGAAKTVDGPPSG